MTFTKDNLTYAITQSVSKSVEAFQSLAAQYEDFLKHEKKHSKQLQGRIKELDTLLQEERTKNEQEPKDFLSIYKANSFKGSADLHSAITRLQALTKSLEASYKDELASYQQSVEAKLLTHARELQEHLNYTKAINGSYSEAFRAISRKKSLINNNGVVVTWGISPDNNAKGEFLKDSLTLRCFDDLPALEPITIDDNQYHIKSCCRSDIGSYHTYKLGRA